MLNRKDIYVLVLILTICNNIIAQNLKRPIILVKSSDKPTILKKIETQPWAKKTYSDFIEKLNQDVNLHESNADAFLRGMHLIGMTEEQEKCPLLSYLS
ncbi:hypothetical protein [Confluentibacter lentus]|uniref:hypothetical protein n=1 Tax=Confluentibacter lentus TaxID=1699412 RepID=UPI000C2844D6|nr:hypothetical protein [Confluentibacter lentus]